MRGKVVRCKEVYTLELKGLCYNRPSAKSKRNRLGAAILPQGVSFAFRGSFLLDSVSRWWFSLEELRLQQ